MRPLRRDERTVSPRGPAPRFVISLIKKVAGMDACSSRSCPGTARRISPLFAVVCLALLAPAGRLVAADYRTQNFIVMAPSSELAKAVGDSAERFRRELAQYWIGRELDPWPTPCPVRVIAGQNLAAQGVTTYNRAPVRDFQMEVVGSPERILDSVLPHEVTHTILATHFGRPLPRWADEGICTTVEHPSERRKHEAKLREFLSSRRGIAMNKLFLLTEYPSDVLPMYAQGYSVCQFLIAQQGPRAFVNFLGDYMSNPSWTHNVRQHYGYDSLAELQQSWLGWVAAGNGPVEEFAKRPTRASLAATSPALTSPAGTNPATAANPAAAANAASSSVRPAAAVADQPLAALARADAGGRGDSLAGGYGESWYSRSDPKTATPPNPNRRQPTSPPTTPPSLAAEPRLNSPRRSMPARPTSRPSRSTNPPAMHMMSQPQPEQGLGVGGYRPGSLNQGNLSSGGTAWR